MISRKRGLGARASSASTALVTSFSVSMIIIRSAQHPRRHHARKRMIQQTPASRSYSKFTGYLPAFAGTTAAGYRERPAAEAAARRQAGHRQSSAVVSGIGSR